MKLRYFILSFLIFSASILYLSLNYKNIFNIKTKPFVLTDANCSCDKSHSDQFETSLRYNYGRYKGSCINACKFRTPFIVKKLERKNNNKILIANLFHQNKFWFAKIPIHKIKKVDVLFENFIPLVNHVSLKFSFDQYNPVLIQEQNSNNKKWHPIKSLVLSPEGIPPVHKKYNLYDALMGNYILQFRIYSGEFYLSNATTKKHSIKSHVTSLDPIEVENLLSLGLNKASNSKKTSYQLLFNNCATETIDLLLEAHGTLRSPDWDFWDTIDPLRGLSTTYPIGTIRSLKWWELINTSSAAKEITEPNS